MNGSLHIEGITKRFGAGSGVHDVSLELPHGSVGVLLGPNGAGKSTLLRLIHGLLEPDAGSVRVLGLDPIRNADLVHASTGYMPDTPDVPGWMTASELFGFLQPLYPTWSRSVVERLTQRFQVPTSTPLLSLSRGQAAKVMLIATLGSAPRLVLLDEPFSGLDPLARRDLLAVFLEELHELGAAALVATHDLDIAARIADQVFVFEQGRLVTAGTVDDVLGQSGQEPVRLPDQLFKLLQSSTQKPDEVAA